jgi:general secretion pathway protein J
MTKQNGLTLIELLIALSLMAVIAVFTWQGLDTLFRSKEKSDRIMIDVSILQNILSQWKFDLDAMQPVKDINPAGLLFDGQALRILRKSILNDGLQIVAWSYKKSSDIGQPHGQWMRWQSPITTELQKLKGFWSQAERWSKNPSNEDIAYQTILIPIDGLQLTYFFGNAWFNPLSSLFTHEFDHEETRAKTMLDKNQPPDAVRLIIELPPDSGLGGSITLDWVSPVFTSEKS